MLSDGGPTQSHGVHGALSGAGAQTTGQAHGDAQSRFHGVFSRGGLPYNSKLRKYVVPQHPVEEPENPKPKAYSMTWAQRLKRVFAIEIEKCEKCGGPAGAPARQHHRIYRGSRCYSEDPEAPGTGSAS
jgi:hypothetical protein